MPVQFHFNSLSECSDNELKTVCIISWMRTFLEDKCTAKRSKNTLSVLRKTVYNIIQFHADGASKGKKQVIDVIDEIPDDFSVSISWIFDPIPSFY